MSLGKGLESLIPPQNKDSDAPSYGTRGPETTTGQESSMASSNSQDIEREGDINASSQGEEEHHTITADRPPKMDSIFYIETTKITPNPQQPRREFNEEDLGSLASSIEQYGVLQPLVVTKKEIEVPHGRRVEYELLAGERRLRAAKLAGFSQVPVIIKEANNQQKLELALIENVQREDLNPIEEAGAYRKLLDEFSLTQEEVADKVGKSRETVANKLRLLSLPKEVQQYIADELVSEGHGKVLLSVSNPERIRMLAKEAIKKGWSVRDLESYIKRGQQPRREQQEPDPQLQHYKKLIEKQLGTTVSISGNPERGRLAITFHSPNDLARLISRLAGDGVPETENNTSYEEPTKPDEPEAFTV